MATEADKKVIRDLLEDCYLHIYAWGLYHVINGDPQDRKVYAKDLNSCVPNAYFEVDYCKIGNIGFDKQVLEVLEGRTVDEIYRFLSVMNADNVGGATTYKECLFPNPKSTMFSLSFLQELKKRLKVALGKPDFTQKKKTYSKVICETTHCLTLVSLLVD